MRQRAQNTQYSPFAKFAKALPTSFRISSTRPLFLCFAFPAVLPLQDCHGGISNEAPTLRRHGTWLGDELVGQAALLWIRQKLEERRQKRVLFLLVSTDTFV